MNSPPKRLIRLIQRSAELRATGYSWSDVGKKLGRYGETPRRWSLRYPEFWERTLADARRNVTAEARDEGLTVLRTLLRSKDDRVKRDASSRLVTLPTTNDAPLATQAELLQFVEFLEGLTDDELESFMREDDAEDQTRPASGDPDAADPPSPA